MKTKVISICCQKGGVGKTTTAISLAAGLALRGKESLLIDFDPQGQCATTLGMNPEPGVFYLLTMGNAPNETAFVTQYVRQTGRERFWLLAGDRTTMAAQTVLSAQDRPISAIRESIARFTKNKFDYIIFDTAPSVGGIQERANWASDLVLIPSCTEFLSTESVRKTSNDLLYLQSQKGWMGALLGVLPTKFYEHQNEHKAAIDDLRLGFGAHLLSPIHRSAALSECPGESQTIFEKAAKSRAALEYQALVDLVLKYS